MSSHEDDEKGSTRRRVVAGMLAASGALWAYWSRWCGFSAIPTAAAERRRPPGSSTRPGGPRLRVALRVRTGSQPKSVTSSPDGSRVVVCHFGNRQGDNVGIYHAETLDRVGTIDFNGNAVESVFSPDGATLYVSNFRRHVVHAIDPESWTIRGEVRVGRHPKWMVVSPDGARLFVANWASGSVSVVDPAQMVELERLPAGRHPRGMAVARDGALYVAAFEDHVIRRFDPPDYREGAQLETCRFPRHLMLSPDDSRVYMSCSSNRQVQWQLTESGARVGFVPVGENPRSIDMTPDGRWIATADFDSDSVSLIDTVGLTHRRNTVRTADRFVGVAIRRRSPLRVYATSWNTAELYALAPDEPVEIETPTASPPEPEGDGPAEVVQPAEDPEDPAEEPGGLPPEPEGLWSALRRFFTADEE